MGKIKKLEILTPKILRDEFNFLIVSDFHLEKQKGFKNLKKLENSPEINYDEIDFIIIPGDLVNNCVELNDPEFKELFLATLERFTRGIPTIVSGGNHDQMENIGPRKWKAGDRFLIQQVLKELSNIKFIKNGEVLRTEEIDFSAFSPFFTYYEGLKEDKEVYRKTFNANTDFEAFTEDKYNVFLTHEPQSIIRLSKENNGCIQKNTDMVVSGHMHDGLLPTPLHKMFGTKGLISPQMEPFPEYAQGHIKENGTDYVINGPVNSRVETPLINKIYGPNATLVKLKKIR